jgi:hypothetical protein
MVRIKAPVAVDIGQPDLNVAYRFFDRLLSQELFSINMYHDDGSGERLDDAVVDRMTLICQTEDSVDIDLICAGEWADAEPLEEIPKSQPIRALTSHDLILEITKDKEEIMGDRITKAIFHADKEFAEIKGKLYGINRFIGDRRSSQIVELLRENNLYRVDLGFGKDSENWIFNLMNVRMELGRREIKDGLDRVEINFEGFQV